MPDLVAEIAELIVNTNALVAARAAHKAADEELLVAIQMLAQRVVDIFPIGIDCSPYNVSSGVTSQGKRQLTRQGVNHTDLRPTQLEHGRQFVDDLAHGLLGKFAEKAAKDTLQEVEAINAIREQVAELKAMAAALEQVSLVRQ